MKTFHIDKSMKDNIIFSMHEDGVMTWHTLLTREEYAAFVGSVVVSVGDVAASILRGVRF